MSRLDWFISTERPKSWDEDILRFGGGFFHTPGGLSAIGVNGQPFYAQVFRNGEQVGLSAGLRMPSRPSLGQGQVFLPTLPAIPEKELRNQALDDLVKTWAHGGAVSVSVDSYDALWQPKPSVTPVELRIRQEYVVSLVPRTDTLWERVDAGHRQQILRGEREGWITRLSSGADARDLLAQVQRLAVDRAGMRADGNRVAVAPFPGDGQDPARTPWGSATFIATTGTTVLAAAMVGWAGGRAVYVVGGSTAEGYRAGASLWLHWRIMCRLAEARFATYNLGGTPAATASPQDPVHGLYRVKAGLGATVVPCCSMRWTVSRQPERVPLGSWLGSAFTL